MDDEVVRYSGVPEQVALGDGLVLRRYVADDLPALVDAVNESLEHLRPWMPWAQQPATVETQGEWFTESQRHWDDGTDFVYGLFDDDGRVLGGTGYHVRNGPGGIEIGYWVAADAAGRGLATRMTAALVEVARGIAGVERVEIHCDVANDRSAAIPRRLGFTLLETREREPLAPGETGRELIWSLDLRRERAAG